MPSAILDRAIDAHGGLDRWRSISEVRLKVAGGGLAFKSKGKARRIRLLDVFVSTNEVRTVLADYPRPGQRGVFQSDGVRIESDDGEVVSERIDPRPAFRKPRRILWWDDLDVLYFVGYAWWGYANAPFAFAGPGFEVRELGDDRLEVRFPENVPAHSREQTFYFDSQGLIRRLDYTAEPFGSWAKAAHLCYDHREFDGLVVPIRRRVHPRRPSGKPLRAVTNVRIDVQEVEARP
jgi:hypothetical protein